MRPSRRSRSPLFDVLRAADRETDEAEGVRTHQLIGGNSEYRANSSRIAALFDTTIAAGATLEHKLPAESGLILYPLEGGLRLPELDEVVRGGGIGSREGPDGMGVAWSGAELKTVRLEAAESPARLLRIEFRRGEEDVVLHQAWRRELDTA